MPQTDDAIAALEQAAEEAGLHFRDFGICISMSDTPFGEPGTMHVSLTGLDGNVNEAAAHALIAWWQRRGWVECPGEPDFHCLHGTRIGIGGYNLRGKCGRCKPHGGEGRVPPDG